MDEPSITMSSGIVAPRRPQSRHTIDPFTLNLNRGPGEHPGLSWLGLNGRFQEWLKEVRALPVRLIMQKVSQKLCGPYGYYGVTYNYRCQQCQGRPLPSLLLIRGEPRPNVNNVKPDPSRRC